MGTCSPAMAAPTLARPRRRCAPNRNVPVCFCCSACGHRQGLTNMGMIGQRLFSGRVAVAWAALTFTRKPPDRIKCTSAAWTEHRHCRLHDSADLANRFSDKQSLSKCGEEPASPTSARCLFTFGSGDDERKRYTRITAIALRLGLEAPLTLPLR